MRFILPLLCVLLLQASVSAELKIIKDITYKKDATDVYEKERCKLDVYLTASKEKVPVFVWFHGGGIQSNSKEKENEVGAIARKFAAKGVAFVAINYRLHPKVKFPAYVEDCAASVKWTIDNADKYGFDKEKVFVGGHSAGGYLTMMMSFKNQFTDKVGLNLSDIAGTIPVSGQTITHSTVRKEMGVSRSVLIVDEKAPLYHSKDMKLPMFLLAGDKDLKMRAEESLLFYSAIEGNAKHSKYEMFKDRDHVSIVTRMIEDNDPAFNAIIKFISEVKKK
ncbi:MAG: alpha/beta hydrolase fold domain-containing protein [Lentisphaeraceae bacterium]|nr:alpha/beta hydrolase fold domain-containing protein [Lentisphaeraceae bacterium]